MLGDGSVLKVGDYPVADVRLDRKRIVVTARVAWNRAQLRSIQQVQETGGEPVQQCRGHLGITEDSRPLRERQVGSDQNAGVLIQLGQQVEQ